MHTLGDIELRGLAQMNAMDSTSEAVYAEHAKIQGKPSIQRTGSKNRTVSMSFTLNKAFVVPEDFIADLGALLDSGQILPLSTEAGDLLGAYVITQIVETRRTSAADGSIISAEVAVSLLEWSTVSGVADRRNAARSAGFAIGATDGQDDPVTPQSDEFKAAAAVTATGSGSEAIGHALESAIFAPTTEDRVRVTVRARLEQIVEDATLARDLINTFTGQRYTDTRDLETDLIAVIGGANTMIALVDTAPINDLRADLVTLLALVDTARRTGQILSVYASARGAE